MEIGLCIVRGRRNSEFTTNNFWSEDGEKVGARLRMVYSHTRLCKLITHYFLQNSSYFNLCIDYAIHYMDINASYKDFTKTREPPSPPKKKCL